jgi:5-methyltetrahydrofolate--homocysteine methyltransferase
MSGLLVKSTLIMRDNLEELNQRGLSHIPVVLGGAALTRSYVERDLREVYEGRLFYGKDAFEGLHVMDRLGDVRRGTTDDDPDWGRVPSESTVPARSSTKTVERPADLPARSPEVETDNELFTPPFLGSRVVKGIPLDEIVGFVNETALFRNQWGYRPDKTINESDDDFRVRLRAVLRDELAKAADILQPAVVYGYFPANGDGDDLVIWADESRDREVTRFAFPRQTTAPFLCIADMFRPIESSDVDYAGFHIVTMGPAVSEAAAKLRADDRYKDYLQLHGLGVEMAEALAELWHKRIRDEWGFGNEDAPAVSGLFRQQYRGGRYSWGYPACPDLDDQAKLDDLLELHRIGVKLTEEFQLEPEQSTSAIIVPHPEAKYFVV